MFYYSQLSLLIKMINYLNCGYKEGCDFILNLNNYQLSVTLFNMAFHKIEEKYNKAGSN